MSEDFKLPGSSYQEVIKIIQGYAILGKQASLADVSKTIGGMDTTTISRNTGFLVSTGILEGGRNKVATSLGTSLGNALAHDQDEEVSRIFSDVVDGSDFLKSVVSAIRIRKGMDDSALRSHIAYSAGAKKGSTTTTGAGTIIEILQTAHAITSEDGKFIVSSGMLPSASSEVDPRTLVSHQSKPKISRVASERQGAGVDKLSAPAVSVPSIGGNFGIQINIDISCEAADLDNLGQKLRKIIDEISTSSEDVSLSEDADNEDAAD